jgi:NAD(P)-dependent dehydrogenase (short-subunit alcohol dehydrogenase family)
MADLPLKGKVALVTGASSGMGRATCIALAKKGANIVAVDLSEKPNPKGYEADLDKTTGEIVTALGVSSIFLQCDISNLAQVDEVFTKAIAVSEYFYSTTSSR